MADAEKMKTMKDAPMTDEEVVMMEHHEESMSADSAIDALAKMFADRFAFHIKAALAANEQPKEK